LALLMQRRAAAREPGRQVLDVLLGKLAGEALHDGIVAAADLVVGERAHQVVVILAGEDRLAGIGRLVALGAMAGRADLRRLLFASLRISGRVRRGAEAQQRCNRQDALHFPVPP
jgi:hypothetical protein